MYNIKLSSYVPEPNPATTDCIVAAHYYAAWKKGAAASGLNRSRIVELIADIHHRLTVIHPFPDGNGRTSRGFMIKMLIRYGMPPFYIDVERKEEYYYALEIADKENNFNALYEYIFKALIRAHVELATRPSTV